MLAAPQVLPLPHWLPLQQGRPVPPQTTQRPNMPQAEPALHWLSVQQG